LNIYIKFEFVENGIMVFLGKSNSKHQNPRETTIVKIVGIDPNGSTYWHDYCHYQNCGAGMSSFYEANQYYH